MTSAQAEAEILNDYIDLLNEQGLGSSVEHAFLRQHESDKDVMRLLSAARALKAAFVAAPGARRRELALLQVAKTPEGAPA